MLKISGVICVSNDRLEKMGLVHGAMHSFDFITHLQLPASVHLQAALAVVALRAPLTMSPGAQRRVHMTFDFGIGTPNGHFLYCEPHRAKPPSVLVGRTPPLRCSVLDIFFGVLMKSALTGSGSGGHIMPVNSS